MSRFLSFPVTRRSFLGIAAMAGPGLWAQVAFGQQAAPTAVIEGVCEDEPAIEMLFDWRAGKSVYRSVAEAGPQSDWTPFNHPSSLGPFLIPPGWTGIAAWTDSFTQDGVPEWQDTPMNLPQLTLSRIVSPDGDAAFEYSVGSIQQVLLSTQQSAQIAKQSVLGATPTLQSVCMIDDQHNQLGPGWFMADKHQTDLLITFGNATQLPSNFSPTTVVSFTNLYGPREDMEQLMYDVFLRILFQFLGGGSGDPTPTPTADV